MKKGMLVSFLVVALVSCGDQGPEAGSLIMSLSTPNSDDGAVQFRLTAAEPNVINSVAVICSGCQLFQERVSDTEILGIVTGSIAAGNLLDLSVSDVNTPVLYSGSVTSVAGRDYSLRSANGYLLAPALQE